MSASLRSVARRVLSGAGVDAIGKKHWGARMCARVHVCTCAPGGLGEEGKQHSSKGVTNTRCFIIGGFHRFLFHGVLPLGLFFFLKAKI